MRFCANIFVCSVFDWPTNPILLKIDIVCVCVCVMRPYTEGRLDRYRIGILRELSEIRTQPLPSEGSLTCDPCQHRDPSFNCAPTQFYHQCSCFHIIKDMLECYLWASNHQPFDYWRAHHVYYVASQPRTSDYLISHWRAHFLHVLAYDNWRCSIQLEIFHSSKCRARAGIRTRVDWERVSYANR